MVHMPICLARRKGGGGVESYLLFLDVSNFVFKAYESIVNVGLICLRRRGRGPERRLQGALGPLAFPKAVVHLGLGRLHSPLPSLLRMAWRWLVTKRRRRELHHWNSWSWRREGGKVQYQSKLGLEGSIRGSPSGKHLPTPSKFSTKASSAPSDASEAAPPSPCAQGNQRQGLAPLPGKTDNTGNVSRNSVFHTRGRTAAQAMAAELSHDAVCVLKNVYGPLMTQRK